MTTQNTTATLTTDSAARKDIPIQRGFLDYFPAAVAEVARLSLEGNNKHNPGEELHWARGKSMDHADCIARHQLDRGTVDSDGFLHETKTAWRAMAQLQEALEARGAPLARGARVVAGTPAPAPAKELAWDEGWVCACGETSVWPGYSRQVQRWIEAGDTAPGCANAKCSAGRGMTRV